MEIKVENILGCRLCLITNNEFFDIFGDDGKNLHIAEVLNKHFWFEIDEIESGNGRICLDCWYKVNNFHNFFMKIYELHFGSSIKFEQIIIDAGKESDLDDLKQTKSQDLVPVECTLIPDDFDGGDYNDQSDSDDNIELSHLQKKFKDEIHDHSDKEEINPDELIDDDVIIKRKVKSVKKKPIKSKGKPQTKKTISESDEIPDLVAFKCLECDKEFRKNAHLQSHIVKTHKEKKKLKNETKGCEKFKRADEDKQIREHFNMTCRICNYETLFETFLELRNHCREKHNQNGNDAFLTCCDHKYFSRSKILEHIRWHQYPDEFKCTECNNNKIYLSKHILKEHMTQFHSSSDTETPFKCEVCGKGFFTKTYMYKHIQKNHVDRSINCELCGKKLKDIKILKSHMMAIHSKARDHICDICGQRFLFEAVLRQHLVHIHSDAKPLECTECGAKLKNNTTLLAHIRRHKQSLENNSCTICNKSFPHKAALRGHVRRVHETWRNNKNKCPFCEKILSSTRSMKEHVASHTGEKLFQCQFCPSSFTFNSAMYIHRKQKHKQEYLEWKRNSQNS